MLTFKSPKSHWWDCLVLFFLAFGVLLFDLHWARLDTRPPHPDMGRHLWTSLAYLHLFHPEHFYRLWTNYYFYPPFRYWITIPFYLIFGDNFETAILSNLVFIFILTFSVYGLGKELWGRLTGILAAIFILANPFYVGQFKEYQLDAPLGAMVALSLYLLVKTKDFDDRKYSIWFGVSLGLGMLTKWTFFFAMVLPTALSLVRARRNGKVANGFLVVLFGFLVSAIWYLNHPRMLFTDVFLLKTQEGDQPLLTLDTLSFYLRALNPQLFLLPLLMFVFGLARFFRDGTKGRRKYLVVEFLIGNYIFFTMLHKDYRYTMPMLVGIALMSVYWIQEIQRKHIKLALVLSFAAYEVATFFIVSFGASWLPPETRIGPLIVFGQHGYLIGPPVKDDWHQEEIVEMISRAPLKTKAVFYDGLESNYFNSWGWAYFCEKYGVKRSDKIEDASFLIIRGKRPLDIRVGFDSIKEFLLPDGTNVKVLKRL